MYTSIPSRKKDVRIRMHVMPDPNGLHVLRAMHDNPVAHLSHYIHIIWWEIKENLSVF